MKVCIFGSRSFDHYAFAERKLDKFLSRIKEEIVIVSGTARGADRIGERYAQDKGYKVVRFYADWPRHGKKAGFIRNEEMADYADVFVAFWDGESSGTEHMIETVRKREKPIRIVRYRSSVEAKKPYTTRR
jgi:hypothetical protein